jgi:hypothetical protein
MTAIRAQVINLLDAVGDVTDHPRCRPPPAARRSPRGNEPTSVTENRLPFAAVTAQARCRCDDMGVGDDVAPVVETTPDPSPRSVSIWTTCGATFATTLTNVLCGVLGEG